ncbi:MAG: copper resistance protein CopC, partial [Gemmatimonadota bacterium]|nr:copper resistance protein CopC [Gemmatimonadota bacterium]
MHRKPSRRRFLRAAFFFGCVGLPLLPASALAKPLHAKLLRSTPAADSRLSRAPQAVFLVFSESVVADLSGITLTRADGSVVHLQPLADPEG